MSNQRLSLEVVQSMGAGHRGVGSVALIILRIPSKNKTNDTVVGFLRVYPFKPLSGSR